MKSDKSRVDDLKKAADSYISLSELTDKLQNDYQELSREFEKQSRQLEDMNSQLSDAVAINSQLSAYLNNTLEALDAGVIVIDSAGQINLFNQAAEKLTGIPRDNALAKSYRDIFPGDEHSPTVELLGSKNLKVKGEKWLGNQPVGYSASRIFNNEGEYYGIVEILYDLSSEKKLRETIRHVSALAAVGEMAATVAHQVRNPLAGIIGFTDLLLRDLGENHRSIGLVNKISRGARELNRIITCLLDYTRKTEPDFRELDIIKFVYDTIRSLKYENYMEKTVINIETKQDELIYRFDPLLLRQAISNIIHNAAQAMEPDGGEVRLKITVEAGYYLNISFEDSGKGLPEGDSDSLFKPFYTTRSDGVGLGLSMARKAVDFHNGRLEACNSSNGGAIFVIKLPLWGMKS